MTDFSIEFLNWPFMYHCIYYLPTKLPLISNHNILSFFDYRRVFVAKFKSLGLQSRIEQDAFGSTDLIRPHGQCPLPTRCPLQPSFLRFDDGHSFTNFFLTGTLVTTVHRQYTSWNSNLPIPSTTTFDQTRRLVMDIFTGMYRRGNL